MRLISDYNNKKKMHEPESLGKSGTWLLPLMMRILHDLIYAVITIVSSGLVSNQGQAGCKASAVSRCRSSGSMRTLCLGLPKLRSLGLYLYHNQNRYMIEGHIKTKLRINPR